MFHTVSYLEERHKYSIRKGVYRVHKSLNKNVKYVGPVTTNLHLTTTVRLRANMYDIRTHNQGYELHPKALLATVYNSAITSTFPLLMVHLPTKMFDVRIRLWTELTPWGTVLLDKLTITHLVKKFALYATRSIIPVFPSNTSIIIIFYY